MVGVEDGADSFGEVVGADKAFGLGYFALCVDPLRFDGVKPRALGRQIAADYSHSLALLLDLDVVRSDPASHLLANVPRSIVPRHQEGRLAPLCQTLTSPVQELGRYAAYRSALDKAQPDLLLDRLSRVIRLTKPQEDTVDGQGLRVGIVFSDVLLDQLQGSVFVGPSEEPRSLEPAPPGLVLKAQYPLGMTKRQTDQAISRPFVRAY